MKGSFEIGKLLIEQYEAELAMLLRDGPEVDLGALGRMAREALCLRDDPQATALNLACAVAKLAGLEEAAARERRKAIATSSLELIEEASALLVAWGKEPVQH